MRRTSHQQHARGALIKDKPRLELLSPLAEREWAKAQDHGNRKAGRKPWNWRRERVKASDQLGAAKRHLAKLLDREDIDLGSLAHHAGHIMARMAIFMEAQAAGTLIDDRAPRLKRAKTPARCPRHGEQKLWPEDAT